MSQAKTDFKVLALIMIIFEQWSEKKKQHPQAHKDRQDFLAKATY